MAPADLLLSLLAMRSAGFTIPASALEPNDFGLTLVTG